MNYFDNPALSQSALKEFKKSPRHYWAKFLDPNSLPPTITDAMRFGTILHAYLFERNIFYNKFIVTPTIDKRTKEGKALYEKFLQEAEDKELITDEQLFIVNQICNSVLEKPIWKIINSSTQGYTEKELYWNDELFNIDCKAKIDYLIEPCSRFPNGLIIDGKTTQSALADNFSSTIYNFGYYNQVAFYCEAVKQIYKTENYPEFIFLAMEKESPYECAFYYANAEMRELGCKENHKLMGLYKKSMESQMWAGYDNKINEIGLPSWARQKIINNLQSGV